MKIAAGFALLAAWLSAALDVTQAKNETVYFALDGELVLRPQVSGPITSITWKNKGNLVAEWVKDVLPLVYYGDFKSDTVLNVDTGVLTIRKMKTVHAGKYKVEVNNKDHPVEYNAVELKKVPRPTVILRPLTCTKETPECTCSCEADVTGVEPVTYQWRMGDGEWTLSEKNLIITNNEKTQSVKTFSCKLENPVSEEDSEVFSNPFYIPPNPVGNIVGGVFAVLVGVGVIGGVIFAYKKKKLPCLGGGNRGEAAPKDGNPGPDGNPGSEGTALNKTENNYEP